PDLTADPPLGELLLRGLHRRQVALGAHHDSHLRGVHVELGELGLRLDHGLRSAGRLAHPATPAAMSRRSCRPSNWIMSAAAYAAARASSAPSPSAVTLSTRPPAVTSAPSEFRAVPACVMWTLSETASRPAMTSPD